MRGVLAVSVAVFIITYPPVILAAQKGTRVMQVYRNI